MGNISTKIQDLFKKECRILLAGIDAAGKTTILYKLKLNETITTIPTIGFNVESIKIKNLEITLWDVGGGDKLWPLYKHYFNGMQVYIRVIDSSDKQRFQVAKEWLYETIDWPQFPQKSIVLILANKQDKDDAASVLEIKEYFELETRLQNFVWNIIPCSAVTGEGLIQAFEWISDQLYKNKLV